MKNSKLGLKKRQDFSWVFGEEMHELKRDFECNMMIEKDNNQSIKTSKVFCLLLEKTEQMGLERESDGMRECAYIDTCLILLLKMIVHHLENVPKYLIG